VAKFCQFEEGLVELADAGGGEVEVVEIGTALEEVGIGETAVVACVGGRVLRFSISTEGHFLTLAKWRLVSWSHLLQAKLASRPSRSRKYSDPRDLFPPVSTHKYSRSVPPASGTSPAARTLRGRDSGSPAGRVIGVVRSVRCV
jgi:hypothetical protein